MNPLPACSVASCIDGATVGTLIAIVCGCWALGYGIGQTILWVKRLGEVS